jgi:myo-inositol-1(or 4)-monophosphatase
MSYERELEFAKELAKDAGKIMSRYFRADDIGTEWKEDDTPLTVADTAVNSLVIARIKEWFPEHGVVGEEASYETNRQWVWVCDPIDGTMPYSLGIPISSFSLGLVNRDDGQAVVGVVYHSALDELYFASRRAGAFLNGMPLQTSLVQDIKKTYLSIIGGTKADLRSNELRPGLCSDLARDRGATPFCLYSQAYSAVKVASGDFAGSIYGYGMPWDSAAASVIVEEAGGIVTDLAGQGRRYDEVGNGCVFASNQAILAELLLLIQESR